MKFKEASQGIFAEARHFANHFLKGLFPKRMF